MVRIVFWHSGDGKKNGYSEAGSAIPENLKKCPARPQKSLGKLGISSRLTLQEDLGLSRQAGLK